MAVGSLVLIGVLSIVAAGLGIAAGWGWGLAAGREKEALAWKRAYEDALGKHFPPGGENVAPITKRGAL